jgi:N-acetylneuraminate lyase
VLSALVLGCRGAVGSTFNYAAPLYHDLFKAFDEGNFKDARKLQQLSVDMITMLGKYGGISTGKAYMKFIGLDCGKFRSPVKNMTDKQYEDFAHDVRLLKIDHLFSKI